MSSSIRRITAGLPALALLMAPAAHATQTQGNSIQAVGALSQFMTDIAAVFAGPLGTAIGIIAFAAVGVYIMYARQTGQAVGSIAKVFVGLLIVFGGTAMVGQISGVTGAMF